MRQMWSVAEESRWDRHCSRCKSRCREVSVGFPQEPVSSEDFNFNRRSDVDAAALLVSLRRSDAVSHTDLSLEH